MKTNVHYITHSWGYKLMTMGFQVKCDTNHLQVEALRRHEEPARDEFAKVDQLINVPLSDVDPEDFNLKLEAAKVTAAVIMGDLSDGKRRVNAAKGPKKRKVQSRAEESSVAEESE